MKASADLAAADQYQLREYAHWRAWALATAHARSGDPAAIAGYIGRRSTFDRALLSFAHTYAEQVERDHAAFTAAIDQQKDVAAVSTRPRLTPERLPRLSSPRSALRGASARPR